MEGKVQSIDKALRKGRNKQTEKKTGTNNTDNSNSYFVWVSGNSSTKSSRLQGISC